MYFLIKDDGNTNFNNHVTWKYPIYFLIFPFFNFETFTWESFPHLPPNMMLPYMLKQFNFS